MRATYLSAIAIALLLVGWLFSGSGGANEGAAPTLAEQNRQDAAKRQDQSPTRVRVKVIHASTQIRHVVLRGQTANKRTVAVKA